MDRLLAMFPTKYGLSFARAKGRLCHCGWLYHRRWLTQIDIQIRAYFLYASIHLVYLELDLVHLFITVCNTGTIV
jgi:hypothetical protein